MQTRRDFLQTGLCGAGAMALASRSLFASPTAGKPPTRFIIMLHRTMRWSYCAGLQ
ncbi:MAG: twin-arginine translocation signal domain-containing protein [Hyphomicrobiaceae bacterium]